MGIVERKRLSSDYWDRHNAAKELESAHWEARKGLFESTLARIESDAGVGRAVDLGGGLGHFAQSALARGWDVYTLDQSELAVAAAAERVGPDRSLSSDDASRFHGTCDLVTLWCVIAHVSDPLAILQRAMELLKPGGKLLLTTPNFLFQAAYARVLARLGRPLDFVAHDHFLHFTPAALDHVLRKAGLGTWGYEYLGVTADCVLERRLSWLLVPAKRAWNRWALHTTALGLPPLCAELQVIGTKPGAV
jgi:2-polyprenyl-3-methyl-5-hydroxy-6-metoxy-1,4-benzoquinol methylase